jgi:hypothetical protein
MMKLVTYACLCVFCNGSGVFSSEITDMLQKSNGMLILGNFRRSFTLLVVFSGGEIFHWYFPEIVIFQWNETNFPFSI